MELEYLIVGGVVAIAAGVAAYCFGKRLRHDMEVALSARSAYMGPVAERLQIETSSGKQVTNDMPSVKTDSR